MLLNFTTNASEHGNRLEKVFRSFNNADNKTFVLSASTAEQIEVPTSFKLFSPFLRELIASLTFSTEPQTFISLPDCSPTSIKDLINLLSHGSTQASTEVGDVETIIEVAKMLGIDLKNLAYYDVNKNDLGKVEIGEEGDIQAADEYYEDNFLEDTKKEVKSQIIKASFATADLAVPNIVQFSSKSVIPSILPAVTPRVSDAVQSSVKEEQRKFIEEDVRNLALMRNRKRSDTADSSKANLDIPNLVHLYCPLCETSFNNENELAEHKTTSIRHKLTAVLRQGTSFQCKICQKKSISQWELLNHCLKVHGRRPYECMLCEYSATTIKKFKKHMKFHGGWNVAMY